VTHNRFDSMVDSFVDFVKETEKNGRRILLIAIPIMMGVVFIFTAIISSLILRLISKERRYLLELFLTVPKEVLSSLATSTDSNNSIEGKKSVVSGKTVSGKVGQMKIGSLRAYVVWMYCTVIFIILVLLASLIVSIVGLGAPAIPLQV